MDRYEELSLKIGSPAQAIYIEPLPSHKYTSLIDLTAKPHVSTSSHVDTGSFLGVPPGTAATLFSGGVPSGCSGALPPCAAQLTLREAAQLLLS